MGIIYAFICIICITCITGGFLYAVSHDRKRFNENRENTLKMLGLKAGITYKLTNKYNKTVYFIRIDSVWENEVISFVCNTKTGNIGLFRNSKQYLLHIIEECDIEEKSEWCPKKEPKI